MAAKKTETGTKKATAKTTAERNGLKGKKGTKAKTPAELAEQAAADQAKTQAQEAADRWNEDNQTGAELVKRTDEGRLIVIISGPAVVLAAGDGLPEIVADVQESGGDYLPEAIPICELYPRAIEEKPTSNLCRVELTAEEIRQAGQEMADAAGELERVKAQAKSTAAQYKAEADEAQTKLTARAQLLREGFETREVACTLTLDYDTGKAREIRTDNGEELKSGRMLHDEEQQRGLDLYPTRDAFPPPPIPELEEKPATETEAPEGDGAPTEPPAPTEPTTPPEPPRNAVKVPSEELELAAVVLIQETERPSTMMLKRRLGVKLSIAQRIIEKLTEAGAIGPGSAPGECGQIIPEKLEEIRARLSGE